MWPGFWAQLLFSPPIATNLKDSLSGVPKTRFHFGKTKILCTCEGVEALKSVNIDDVEVDVLTQEAAEKYLGRKSGKKKL